MRLPLALAAAVGLATTGCIEEDASMFIEGVLPLQPDDCEVLAADNVFASNGALDLTTGRGYTAQLKVRTNLPATFNNQDVQQSRTQSPNFPNYGAVDNNVVIFETAEVNFSLATDGLTAEVLAEAVGDVEGAEEALDCNNGTCTTRKPDVVPAGGTAFNIQTQLNREALVTTDLLSSATAQTLLRVYKAAKAIAATRGILEEGTFLDVPAEAQRLSVNVVLIGRTTGSQTLRPVRSAPFPFGIDICVGCLAPDSTFCRTEFGENVESVLLPDAQACIAGQDFPIAACGCADAAGDVTFIDADRGACAP